MVVLISSNQEKINEILSIFGKDLVVKVQKEEYDEIKYDNPCDVANAAATLLAKKINETVIVEDSGFFIEELNGFPGTVTKFAHTKIGNAGFVRLMAGIKNRKCWYKSAVSICEPNGKPICFLGEEMGSVANTVRGVKGWGQDPIFIPIGSDKTYGELGNDGYHKFRYNAVILLKEHLTSRNNRK